MASFGFASDGTLKELVSAAEATNIYMASIAAAQAESMLTSVSAVRKIVEAGNAAKIFSIGDKLTETWNDSVNVASYDAEHLMVDFTDVELEDESSVPGMILQWKYAEPYEIPFDAREAFYYAEDGLSAGTYSFTFGATWGMCVAGDTWYFTLTKDVPAGGQLVFESDIHSTTPEGTNIIVYSSSDSTEAYETVQMTLTAPDGDAASLGEMSTALTKGNLNGLYRAIYGYNRWSQSAVRQWLNSAASAGAWWSAQNVWDRPPAEAATYPGFMSGYGEEFLNAIQKVKVTTSINTSEGGEVDTTYDYFFLPSLEQMYIAPEVEGAEGSTFAYYKRIIGSSGPVKREVSQTVIPGIYGIDATTTKRVVRLRSATRFATYMAWAITAATGYIGGYNASKEYRVTPVCVIC